MRLCARSLIALRTWDEGIHGGIAGSPDLLYLRVAPPDAGFYHPDYMDDGVTEGEIEADWTARAERWKIPDNPYRYYRW